MDLNGWKSTIEHQRMYTKKDRQIVLLRLLSKKLISILWSMEKFCENSLSQLIHLSFCWDVWERLKNMEKFGSLLFSQSRRRWKIDTISFTENCQWNSLKDEKFHILISSSSQIFWSYHEKIWWQWNFFLLFTLDYKKNEQVGLFIEMSQSTH